jgi:hypothetical protein
MYPVVRAQQNPQIHAFKPDHVRNVGARCAAKTFKMQRNSFLIEKGTTSFLRSWPAGYNDSSW